MSQFGLSMRVKDQFFDRDNILFAVDQANRRVLSRLGAFIRRRARTSLRRRKRISAAGQPPRIHSRDSVQTLKNILFAYDPGRTSVVIGPVLLNHNPLIQGTIPQLLEFGGNAGIREYRLRPAGPWLAGQPRSKRQVVARRVRSAKYAARPFMGPALAAETPNLASHWRGQVTAA